MAGTVWLSESLAQLEASHAVWQHSQPGTDKDEAFEHLLEDTIVWLGRRYYSNHILRKPQSRGVWMLLQPRQFEVHIAVTQSAQSSTASDTC